MACDIAHTSDLHLTGLHGKGWRRLAGKRLFGYLSWALRRKREHRPEILAALKKDLDAAPPEVLLVTGDLTHLGLPGEFVEAKEFLGQLGGPERVLVVPGNHEAYARCEYAQGIGLLAPYLPGEASQPIEGPPAWGVFPRLDVRGEFAFVGLSTATPTPVFSAAGRVGRPQIRRLETMLSALGNEGFFRILYLHHPAESGVVRHRKDLEDRALLLDCLEKTGVELVLHGHAHRSVRSRLRIRGQDIWSLGVGSGSAMGLRGEERRARYHRLRLDREKDGVRLTLTVSTWDPESRSFTAADAEDLGLILHTRGANQTVLDSGN